ncbi:hypothetical protein TNCV_2382171 [Trichonephila clavipes]|nr:hypothetical protein TNCV_2382171 [Trichonephila clavipes]
MNDLHYGTQEMFRWCLNVFEKIVVKHLYTSLKIHTSRKHPLRESIRRKRPQFWENVDWYLLHDNAPAHRYKFVKELVPCPNLH